MANILNLWRVDLRVLLSGLSSMSKSDVVRLTRLFTYAPKSQWADVIRRQKGYDVPADTPRDNREISDSQVRATATKRCPSCGTYCTHRHSISRSTRLDGQWWCISCLDNLTK